MEDKKRILIVEDEVLIAMIMEECLIVEGYEVVGVASKGEDALEYAETHKPDLIIMDIFLKGEIDGIETTEHINEHHDVPVIYLTSNTDLPTYKRAGKTAHYGYYEKPLTALELQKAVQSTFEFIRFQEERSERPLAGMA